MPLNAKLRNQLLEFSPAGTIARKHKPGLRKLANNCGGSCDQPGMALHITVHVADQNDPSLIGSVRCEPTPVSRPLAKLPRVDAVVDDTYFSRWETVVRQDRFPHGIRIGENSGREILHPSNPYASLCSIQLKMRQVTLTGNDYWYSGDHSSGDTEQIRVKVVGVNYFEPAPAQEHRQAEHLIDPVYRIKSSLGIKLPNANRRSRQPFKQRTAGSETTQRHLVGAAAAQPYSQLDGLNLSPPHIKRIQQEKNFAEGWSRPQLEAAAPAVRLFSLVRRKVRLG